MSPALRDGEPAGIAVVPGDRLTIELAGGQRLDTAVVSLTAGDQVVVKTSTGQTTFDSGTDRLVVRHTGAPGRIEISIPRSAYWVEVKVGESRVLVTEGARVIGEVKPDHGGRYLIPLAQFSP
jgi:hypothetical protein